MSSHHSQKSILLHHSQVNAGRERKLQRRLERLSIYWMKREESEANVKTASIFGFICFAYSMIATAVYMGYIMPAIVG